MTVDANRRPVDLQDLNSPGSWQWVFPGSWAVFGALMVGALAICYLIEENQVPSLGLSSWFLVWLLWIPSSFGISYLARRWPIDRRNWQRRVAAFFLAGLGIVATLLVLRV